MDTNDKNTAAGATDKPAAKATAAKTAAASKTASATDPSKETAKTAATSTDNKSANPTDKDEKALETAKGGPLYKFFTDALKDIYFAEKHILEALPKMQKAATTAELQDAFEDHYLLTQKHVSRLEKVFKLIEEPAETKKCDAIIGIVKEGENIIKETEEGSMTRDAALIIAAQKVEHYEIASYGGLAALAETLELYDASEILHKTLEEEEDTDHDLTDIAESFINFSAAEDDEDEEDDEWYDYDEEDFDDDDDNEYDIFDYSKRSIH